MTAARREGEDYVLEFDERRELRGHRLLVATGRRPRVGGLGLETVAVEADGHGIPVDAHLRAGERLWAIGDANGAWPLTYVGNYQGDVVAENILGEPREVNYEASDTLRAERERSWQRSTPPSPAGSVAEHVPDDGLGPLRPPAGGSIQRRCPHSRRALR
jgi:hypothetical protein